MGNRLENRVAVVTGAPEVAWRPTGRDVPRKLRTFAETTGL